jgi:hypothetical protein
LHGPRQTPPGCVLIAILGDPNRVRAGSAERTRLGDGGGCGGRHAVPRVEPDGPKGYLEMVLPVYGPLVSYVPDGD